NEFKSPSAKIHGRHDRLPIPGEASRECAQLRATDSRELRCHQHILIPLKGYFWRQVTHPSLYEGWRLGQGNNYSFRSTEMPCRLVVWIPLEFHRPPKTAAGKSG